MPRTHKFTLGDRIANGLYDLLDGLVEARYSAQKRAQLGALNIRLEQLRFQTRLMFDFELISAKRYEYASLQLRSIGTELGGWLKQQSQKA